MKHFSPEEWVDFVNQTASRERMQVMQKHLEAGCGRCARQATLWRKVRTLATVEAAYQPPEGIVRSASAQFGAARTASAGMAKAGIVGLLFDSFSQPALAGVRAAGTGTRQMLYRAESYQIDMQIEAKPSGGRILVTGQVLDVSCPEMIRQGLPVTLSNRRGSVVHVVTNEFGEFHAEIQNSGDLELSLRGHSGGPIVISLKDPLGDLSGSEK